MTIRLTCLVYLLLNGRETSEVTWTIAKDVPFPPRLVDMV